MRRHPAQSGSTTDGSRRVQTHGHSSPPGEERESEKPESPSHAKTFPWNTRRAPLT